MAGNPNQKACENCGSTKWTHETPHGNDKRGLQQVIIAVGGPAQFGPHASVVDMWFCDGCGLARLFRLPRRS